MIWTMTNEPTIVYISNDLNELYMRWRPLDRITSTK